MTGEIFEMRNTGKELHYTTDVANKFNQSADLCDVYIYSKVLSVLNHRRKCCNVTMPFGQYGLRSSGDKLT